MVLRRAGRDRGRRARRGDRAAPALRLPDPCGHLAGGGPLRAAARRPHRGPRRLITGSWATSRPRTRASRCRCATATDRRCRAVPPDRSPGPVRPRLSELDDDPGADLPVGHVDVVVLADMGRHGQFHGRQLESGALGLCCGGYSRTGGRPGRARDHTSNSALSYTPPGAPPGSTTVASSSAIAPAYQPRTSSKLHDVLDGGDRRRRHGPHLDVNRRRVRCSTGGAATARPRASGRARTPGAEGARRRAPTWFAGRRCRGCARWWASGTSRSRSRWMTCAEGICSAV